MTHEQLTEAKAHLATLNTESIALRDQIQETTEAARKCNDLNRVLMGRRREAEAAARKLQAEIGAVEAQIEAARIAAEAKAAAEKAAEKKAAAEQEQPQA